MSTLPLRLAACAACVCAALSTVAYSATVTQTYANTQRNEFFNKNAEGWFWYIDPAPEPEPVEEVNKEPQSTPSQSDEKTPPPLFSLAWVKEMLPRYMEKAWNEPTPENVEAYFIVQRFVMDRATKFSDVAQSVVIGNTALDETMRRPLSLPGAAQTTMQVSTKTYELMNKVAQHAGIWFFFRSDCRYCEAQAPILGFLEFDGFPIIAISVDGGELKSKKFPKTYQDRGHAEKLGVTATPAVFLVSEDGKFDALGMSVLSLDELHRRILIVAQRNGWLTEEEVNEAKPIMNPNNQKDLSKELPKLIQATADPTKLFGDEKTSQTLVEMAQGGEATTIANKDHFIEPSKLIELVNSHKSGVINNEEREKLAF